MNIKIIRRILRCYVCSIFCYASETLTLSQGIEKKITVFEMWCYHQMLRSAWMEKMNEKMLQKMGLGEPMLLQMIANTKDRFIKEEWKH